MTTIPDYIEPVEGWRVWFVDSDFLLRSVAFDVVWRPEQPLVATCLRRRRSRRPPWRLVPPQHDAPEERCRCGIYGAAERETALRYIPFALPRCAVARVLGRVALWGDVVECDAGWRASRAYPARLYVPTTAATTRRRNLEYIESPETIALGLAQYGVPIEFVDSVPEDDLPEPIFR